MLSNMVVFECFVDLVNVCRRLTPNTLVGPVMVVVGKVRA